MSIAARWTPDCNGKQDFNGPIIEISTRYWPHGVVAHIKPSANASIVLRDIEEDHDYVLNQSTFSGEAEANVKQQVERWAACQFSDISNVIKEFFKGQSDVNS